MEGMSSTATPLQPFVRRARPGDYDVIAAVADAWWGRPIIGALPRLFLDHFHATSLIAERGETLVGFLIGFVSPSQPGEAYIHFVGVSPAERGRGLARDLYAVFISQVRAAGCTAVSAVTSPVNSGSIAFHARLGFSVAGPVADYNGPGLELMTFRRPL